MDDVITIMPSPVHMSRPIEANVTTIFCIILAFMLPSIPTCGINHLTYAAEFTLQLIDTPGALPVDETRHKTCEVQQVRNAEERPIPPNDNFRIRANGVRPLRRN